MEGTRTPLHLSTTTVNGKVVYWAITDPLPTLLDGPFLAPPGRRPPTYPLTEGSATT